MAEVYYEVIESPGNTYGEYVVAETIYHDDGSTSFQLVDEGDYASCLESARRMGTY